MTIESKSKFLTPSGFILLFVVLLDAVMLFMFIDSLTHGPVYEDKISQYIFGFITFILINGLVCFQYIVTNPKWKLNEKEIEICHLDGTKYSIQLSEIKEIELTGQQNIPFFLHIKAFRDAVLIKTERKEYFLPIDNYTNINILQKELSILFKNKTSSDFTLENYQNVNLGNTKIYNKWKVFNFHMFYMVFICTILFLFSNLVRQPYSFLLFGTATLFVFISGKLTYYIGLTNDFFVIKNNVYFWQTIVFKKTDILSIYLEQGGRAPLRMYITLKDFTKKYFIVESVGTNNLRQIMNELKEQGVKVQGEI